MGRSGTIEGLRAPAGARSTPLWPGLISRLMTVVVLGSLVWTLGRGLFAFFGMQPPPPQPLLQPPGPATVVGIVHGSRASGVGTPFSAVIAEMHVRKGQRVRRGELLFRMDTRKLEKRLQAVRRGAARAGVALRKARRQQTADLQARKSEVLGIRAKVQRQRRLLAEREAAVRKLRPAVRAVEASGTRHPGRRLAAGPHLRLRDASVRMERARAELKRLKREHAVASARLQQSERRWHSRMADAIRLRREAGAGEGPILALLEQAARRSPREGIVTSVSAASGDWVKAKQPVVRVDDPEGYRLVALVGQETRDVLGGSVSATYRTASRDSTASATVTRVEPGWGRNLFRYWLYLTPEAPETLAPGQGVEITLPAQLAGRSGSELENAGRSEAPSS